MKKLIISIYFIFILTACSTIKTRDNSLFFQGNPNSDCKYLGYIESDNTGETPNDGFDGAKSKLLDQALKHNSNAVRIVNYNMAINTFKLSAEMYYCPNTKDLQKSANELFFNLEDTN